MKSILLKVPDELKDRLDAKRAQGFTLNGYINAVLARELAHPPTKPRRKARG